VLVIVFGINHVKLRSFRLRIALLSAMLAGASLASFGILSWWLTYDAKVSRLDAVLENILLTLPVENISQFDERSLFYKLGTSPQTPIALLANDQNNQTIYKSNRWPNDLNLTDLWEKFPPPLPSENERQPPPFFDRGQPPPDFRPPRVPLKPKLVIKKTKTETWRVGLVTFPHTQIAIAVSLNIINQEMAIIGNIFLISIPLSFFIIAAGAWALSGSALSPIRQLIVTIKKVTINGLNQQVYEDITDIEFLELIQVFNQMLARLERSFQQASRFSGDAAHELKTPLAILQGELERTLQQVEMGSEVQQRLGNLLDEVHRLSGIIRKLLLLSLADAGQMSLYKVKVNISTILTEMLEDIELLAPDLDVKTSIAVDLQVNGDQDLLIQVLQNLLSNAIKYNLSNGWIKIQAEQKGQNILITISNASKDIPKNDRQRIFDRFHRGDPSRNRKVEGTGLGLSLAREIVIAHGGKLTLDPTPSGQTSFSLIL
jgi:signal transduction histidine kinase